MRRWLWLMSCCVVVSCDDGRGGTPSPADTSQEVAADQSELPPEMVLRLEVEVVDPAPLGVPLVIAVRADAAVTTQLTLWVGDEGHALRLYRGRGSIPYVASAAGEMSLRVTAPHVLLRSSFMVAPREVAWKTERISAGEETWLVVDEGGLDVGIEGTLRVDAGARLRIGPGVRVLLGEKARLVVEGELVIEGSAAAPVLFTRAGAAAWGGVHLRHGATGVLHHAWFVGGGGDEGRALGHSNSQPVVLVDDGRLEMVGGGLVDNVGKAVASRRAEVVLRGVLVSRCDTGGELMESVALIDGCHFVEIPDADGIAEDDDNDGIYLLSALERDGVTLQSVVRDTVFAMGEDDGIDHNNALVRVERCWIEGFANEGVAASAGRRIEVVDTVVQGCEQGIEAGYGPPEVIVERTVVRDCDVGLRIGDSYDWEVSGSMTVRQSVVTGNRLHNVWNHVNALGGPLEGALEITCSAVDSDGWDGSNDNVAGAVVLDAEGCAVLPWVESLWCDAGAMGLTRCE